MIKLPFRFFRIRGAIALLITFIVLRILFNDFFSSLEYTAVHFLGLTNHAIYNADQALGPMEGGADAGTPTEDEEEVATDNDTSSPSQPTKDKTEEDKKAVTE